jgi:hypothetical protein
MQTGCLGGHVGGGFAAGGRGGGLQRPNPKSLIGDKVDSGIGLRSTWHIGLPMVNVLESTLEWTW